MAYQGISTGTSANDGTGDSLLTGAVKINSNFQEIYNALGDGSSIRGLNITGTSAADGDIKSAGGSDGKFGIFNTSSSGETLFINENSSGVSNAILTLTHNNATIGGSVTVNGTINSAVSTGTSPLTVSSTTKVDNLNVDLIDGIDSSQIVFGNNGTKTTTNNNWDSALSSGFYDQYGLDGLGTPGETWYHLITSRHTNTANNYQMQISGSFYDDKDFYYRIINNGNPSSWNRIWHSGNDGPDSGLDADTVDTFQASRLLRSLGHPGYGNWNTFGNDQQTVYEVYQENFNIGSNTGSSNFPDVNYRYGTLINFGSNESGRAQVYISHSGNDLAFRGGWGTSSWQSWNRVWTDVNDGPDSGLNADLLDNLQSSSSNTANTIVARDNTGSISVESITVNGIITNSDLNFQIYNENTQGGIPDTSARKISFSTRNFSNNSRSERLSISESSLRSFSSLFISASDIDYSNYFYGQNQVPFNDTNLALAVDNSPGIGRGDIYSNGGTSGEWTFFNVSHAAGRAINFGIATENLTAYQAIFRMYRNGIIGGYYVDCPIQGTTFAVNGTKNFKIDHPIDETKKLVHVSVEGPRADLLYRGTIKLKNGTATVNLDEEYGLIPGTWKALCRNSQVWVTSSDGWEPCRGFVTEETLTIQSKDPNCTETVNWLVVAERQDSSMYNPSCDENGRPILEPNKD